MRVRLERSGGIANIRRTTAVNTEALAPERVDELRRLLAGAGLDTFSEHPTPVTGKPDRFVYRLTVEDGDGIRAITVGEDATSTEMRRLIDWLETTAAG